MTPLYPCRRKGCPWRGPDPDACPMHESDDAWERQPSLQRDAHHDHKRRRRRHRQD